LITYTLFNTIAHVAAITTVYVLDPEFDGENDNLDKVCRVPFYLFFKAPTQYPAGFDLTTHSSRLLGGRKGRFTM
jgi:hypothetical protein